MRVYKRGQWWWADFAFASADGDQRWRKSLGLAASTPKREAQAKAEELRAGMHTQTFLEEHGVLLPQKAAAPSCAFSGLAHIWLEHKRPDLVENSVRRYREVIKSYLVSDPLLGDRQVTTITYLDVMALRTRLADKLAPNSVNQALKCLFGIMRLGVKLGYLQSDPTQDVRLLPRPVARAWDWLTETEGALFLSSVLALRPDFYLVFLLALRTGARLGEVLSLEWGDVDFVRQEISVRRTVTRGLDRGDDWQVHERTKGGEGRRIPMTTDLKRALEEARHLRGSLVCCKEDGRPFEHRRLEAAVGTVCRHAGLRRLRFHDLRHSYAAQLANKGVSIQVIAQLLGHKNLKTTQIYAHLAPSTLHAAVGLLEPVGTKKVHSSPAHATDPDRQAVHQAASTIPTMGGVRRS